MFGFLAAVGLAIGVAALLAFMPAAARSPRRDVRRTCPTARWSSASIPTCYRARARPARPGAGRDRPAVGAVCRRSGRRSSGSTTLDPNAQDARRLMSVHLPGLIDRYLHVPAAYRGQTRRRRHQRRRAAGRGAGRRPRRAGRHYREAGASRTWRRSKRRAASSSRATARRRLMPPPGDIRTTISRSRLAAPRARAAAQPAGPSQHFVAYARRAPAAAGRRRRARRRSASASRPVGTSPSSPATSRARHPRCGLRVGQRLADAC